MGVRVCRTPVVIMKKIVLNSFAKVNISLDIRGKREDGYHEVETFMQAVDLADSVMVRWFPFGSRDDELASSQSRETVEIEVSTNRPYLPTDERNLAFKAAQLMAERFGAGHGGDKLRIDIKKRIPVAAGLAGGSSNAAAVLHAVNRLWGLKLGVAQLCELAEPLGADVPFCVMTVAATNLPLGGDINKDPLAITAAIGRGTGAEVSAATPLDMYAVLSKPNVKVSTKDVYGGIDEELEKAEADGIHVHHPRAEVIEHAIKTGDDALLADEMGNLLELYTIKRNSAVAATKSELRNQGHPLKVMMSGSGPTVFALYRDKGEAKEAAHMLKKKNKSTFAVRTI